MVTISLPELNRIVQSINNLTCWHVSCGAVGSTFKLALGEKVLRKKPIRNPDPSSLLYQLYQKKPKGTHDHSSEFRQYEGEGNLLVWCTWRLDANSGPITSSDDTIEGFKNGLQTLLNTQIRSVEIFQPAWDLNIIFSND